MITVTERRFTVMHRLFLFSICSIFFHVQVSGFSVSTQSRCRTWPVPFTSSRLKAATTLPLEADGVPAPEPAVTKKQSSKVGVLLLNLGGPETGDDVEGAFE